MVRACLIPIFRYGAGLVDWSDQELDRITSMWANARRLAWKLAPGTPHCLHTLHRLDGGGHIPHARILWAKEMQRLWSMCRMHDDDLRTIAQWEWSHSAAWVGGMNDQDASRHVHGPREGVVLHDLANRYQRVCAQLGTKV